MKKKTNKYKVKYSKIESAKEFFKGKKPAPSGLIITFGQRGSGKTTMIAKDYLKWLKKDNAIYNDFYSNTEFKLKTKETHYLDLEHYKFTDYIEQNKITKKYGAFTDPTERGLEDTPYKIRGNCIIEIDELGIIANSRDYKNFPKELIHFIKILRKLGILFKANSQTYDIDKQMRLGASDLRLMTKIGYWTISRKIKKYIAINESKDDNGNAESQIVDRVEFASILEKDAIKITFIPFYTKIYDSFM